MQKKLASRMLNAGIGKIWFDPLRAEDIKQAITRADISDLIKDKAIRVKAGKKKTVHVKRKRKRKAGSRKMIVKNRKERYVNQIRKMRRYLHEISQKGEVSEDIKWKLRGLAKAGQFRSLKHLKEHIKTLNFEKSLEKK